VFVSRHGKVPISPPAALPRGPQAQAEKAIDTIEAALGAGPGRRHHRHRARAQSSFPNPAHVETVSHVIAPPSGTRKGRKYNHLFRHSPCRRPNVEIEVTGHQGGSGAKAP